MLRRKENIQKIPEESTDVFQQNIPDDYLGRSVSEFQNVKLVVIDSIFAVFLSYPYMIANQLDDEIMEIIYHFHLLVH